MHDSLFTHTFPSNDLEGSQPICCEIPPTIQQPRCASSNRCGDRQLDHTPELSKEIIFGLEMLISISKLLGHKQIVIPSGLIYPQVLQMLLEKLPSGWTYHYDNSPSRWVLIQQ